MLLLSLILAVCANAEVLPSKPQPDLPVEFVAALERIARAGPSSPRDCSVEDCSLPKNFNGSWPSHDRRALQFIKNGCRLFNNLPGPCVCKPINDGHGVEFECVVNIAGYVEVSLRMDIEPCHVEPHVEFFFKYDNEWMSVAKLEYGLAVMLKPVLPGLLYAHVHGLASAGVFLFATLGGTPGATTVSFGFDICGELKIFWTSEACGADVPILRNVLPLNFWESSTVNLFNICPSPPPHTPPLFSATASPPPLTENAMWTIISGKEYCQLYLSNCVTNSEFRQGYGPSENCIIRANAQLSATASYFETELEYDSLNIANGRYSGDTGPSKVAMSVGWTMIWRSDASIQRGGFTICGTACPNCLGADGICYLHKCGNVCQWNQCPAPPSPPISPTAAAPGPPPFVGPPSCACANTCMGNPAWSRDGICDDGGAGAEYSGCALGTDCADCDFRCDQPVLPSPSPVPESCLCSDECTSNPTWTSDGLCDDGGQGSEYSGCPIGTDCSDCGVRCDLSLAIRPPSYPPTATPLWTGSASTTSVEPPFLPSSSSAYREKPPMSSPSPPPPPELTLAIITVTLTAAGSISDYTDRSELRASFASAASSGVSASDVTINVVAASVIITAEITVQDNIATQVSDSLKTSLASTAAASKLLGITVISTPRISVVQAASPSNASDSPDGISIGLVVGIASGAVVGIVLLVCAVIFCKTRAKAKSKIVSAGIAPAPARGTSTTGVSYG